MCAKLELMVMVLFLLVFIVSVGILLYVRNVFSLWVLFWDKLLYFIVHHRNKYKKPLSSEEQFKILLCASRGFVV